MRSWDAIVELFASRKFIVMLVGQLMLVAPALAGKINVELAATLGVTFAAVWQVAHSNEEKAKLAAAASAASDAAFANRQEPIPPPPPVPTNV